MSDFLRKEIMRVLQGHKGRANAIPRDLLMAHLDIFKPKIQDREVRRLYAGLPVCSCDDGIFIPMTVREVLDFKDYLSNGPGGPKVAYRRVAIVLSFRPELAPPAEQLGLPGMGGAA